MKKILIAITATLLAAARSRAEQAMRTHAEARIGRAEEYTSNAGGWN